MNAALLRETQSFPRRIPKQVAFTDIGQEAAPAAERHDFFPSRAKAAPRDSPPRFSCRILLNTDNAHSALTEVYAPQFLGPKPPNRVVFVSQVNCLRALGERLLSDRNHRLSKRHRPACVSVCCKCFILVRILYPDGPATPRFDILGAAGDSLPICGNRFQ